MISGNGLCRTRITTDDSEGGKNLRSGLGKKEQKKFNHGCCTSLEVRAREGDPRGKGLALKNLGKGTGGAPKLIATKRGDPTKSLLFLGTGNLPERT